MDGNNADRGAQQLVVAIAVGGRLDGEFQCIGHLERRNGRRRRRPMQEVHDMRAGHDLFIERHGAGLADRLQAIESDHCEHLHELPIAVGVPRKPFAQPRHGTR